MRNDAVGPQASILQCMEQINKYCQQLMPVIDDGGHLLGVVADGDIRRAIIAGQTLDKPVSSIMNKNPVCIQAEKWDIGKALFLLRSHSLRWLPVVDVKGRFVRIWSLEDLLQLQSRDNMVVIMAGGLGTRLAPLTNDIPKPMLPVGGRPLLEHIVMHFARQGFRSFVFAVNYKKEIIEEHFQDGSSLGVSIHYLYERKRLGTAGSLALIDYELDAPFIVMNGDILTTFNFGILADTHKNNNSYATIVTRQYVHKVPFGVVREDSENRLLSLEEKPEISFKISAGINIFSPAAISLIPKDSYFDMPDLYKAIMARGYEIKTCPCADYWCDIGNLKDYQKANNEIMDIFELP